MPRPILKSEPGAGPSLVGLTLDSGRYKIISELGAGSFAQVYKAQVLSNETSPSSSPLAVPQYVAVKVLSKSGLSPSQLQNQRNEIRFLKALSDHPYICRLLRSLESETQVFLIMELCDTDLFDLIVPPKSTTRQGLPEPLVRGIFGQLASAMAYAHSKGIYHRDLKPENVLIQKDLVSGAITVKLSDFGLATQSKVSKEFGCGSVRYMSPECLDSKLSPSGYSPESNDVWSLAIILINLLTGKNPWVEPRRGDVNYSLYSTETQALSTLRSQFKLSHELSLILSRVFSPDTSRRLSLADFAESVYGLSYLRSPSLPMPSPPVSIPSLSVSPPTRTALHCASAQAASQALHQQQQQQFQQPPVYGSSLSSSTSTLHTTGPASWTRDFLLSMSPPLSSSMVSNTSTTMGMSPTSTTHPSLHLAAHAPNQQSGSSAFSTSPVSHHLKSTTMHAFPSFIEEEEPPITNVGGPVSSSSTTTTTGTPGTSTSVAQKIRYALRR